MRDAQKPDHVSLNTLIGRLKEGRFVVPDFQREFEWKPWDIRDLMRSIFLDYYIGSLLLWRSSEQNLAALSCEQIHGFEEKDVRPEHIVLDGQQRLTAMYYAFMAPDCPLPKRTKRAFFYIRVDLFMEEQFDQAFQYEWSTKTSRKLFSDRIAQFEHHIFPLAVVGIGGWDLGNWVQDYQSHWTQAEATAREAGEEERAGLAANHRDNAGAFGELLKGITEQYQVSYIELDRDLGVDKVCDIFTQINSRGIRLDAFDLINALLKPKGLQLKHMWRSAAPRLEFVESDKLNVYLLQIMSILKQAYCSPKYLYFLIPGSEKPVRDPDGTRRKETLVPDITQFKKLWERSVEALVCAVQTLQHPQEFGAVSSRYLPYVSILPVFAALQEEAKGLPPQRQLGAQRKIRHWYWASVFTNRYSGSVESTSARDFLDIKAWFNDDTAPPALLEEFKHRFNTLDLLKETKSGSSVYNGIFNLLVIRGAPDWLTGKVPQHGDLDDHHIVPRAWGRENVRGNHINSILNRTPLSANSNRNVIKDRLPNQYLPELIEQNGEEMVRALLEAHLISSKGLEILLRDPFGPQDFQEFLSERQRTITNAIESLLVKERLDLPPDLRRLDERIEAVELTLRTVIVTALSDQGELPAAIEQAVQERIQRASARNPALELDRFESLTARVEYCDLRELEAVIKNRTLWEQFAPTFSKKDLVAKRFDQLTEVRNGIRHSRAVDEVALREGEAAILWFEQVLGAGQ